MANKLFSFAVLFMLSWTPNSLLSTNNVVSNLHETSNSDFCNLPAPSNFQVASIGQDFASLTWVPEIIGATHTLILSQMNNGGWTNAEAFPSVLGSSIILSNLPPAYYKAEIATNCPSGEASYNVTEVFFELKVIDLTVGGRIPVSPQIVEKCWSIDYLKHNWVGFQIRNNITGNSNFFELKFNIPPSIPSYEYAEIKRVYNSSIVAIDQFEQYPVLSTDALWVSSPFRLVELTGENSPPIEIGYVELFTWYQHPEPLIVNLCPDPLKDWNGQYSFYALTAESTIINPPGLGGEQGFSKPSNPSLVKISSPFSDQLIISELSSISNSESLLIQLFNLNGQLIFENELPSEISSVALATDAIHPGIYVVNIKSGHKSHFQKVVKFN